jgi:hypothetical protein
MYQFLILIYQVDIVLHFSESELRLRIDGLGIGREDRNGGGNVRLLNRLRDHSGRRLQKEYSIVRISFTR